jgi:hypothetical protein
MALRPSTRDASPVRPARDLEAFLIFISTLSGKLAGATGDAVDGEVEAGTSDRAAAELSRLGWKVRGELRPVRGS